MLVSLLVAACVVLLPVPTLVVGAHGLFRHPGYSPDEPSDRVSVVVLIGLRMLVWLLVFALSVVVLVSTVGAVINDVDLHGMVYALFGLDLLLSLIIAVSFGRRDRRDRRPSRRRGSPAPR